MAYKFQLGDSVLSGALEQEGNIVASAGVVSASSHVQAAGNLAVAGTSAFVGAISGSSKLEIAGKSFFGDSLVPNQDGEIDLGSSSKEWKDLYIDGVAYIDSLQADQLGAALDANSQAITNVNIDSGAIDNAVIGANTAAAATFTTLVAGGDVDLGDATSDTITATGRFDSDLVPSTDSARALGSSALQWSAVHVDVGHIDQLGSALDANSQAITNINVDSGAIDGVAIGANSASTAKFTTLSASSTLQVAGVASFASDVKPNEAGGAALGASALPFSALYVSGANDAPTEIVVGNGTQRLIGMSLDGGTDYFQMANTAGALAFSSSVGIEYSGGGSNGMELIGMAGFKVYGDEDGSNLSASILKSGVISGSAITVAGNATVAGKLLPNDDDASDLGSSSKQFKDLYLDGVAYIDSLQADQLGAALDANSQAITNINVDSGAIDGTTVGASSQAAGKFTTLSGSGAASFAAGVTMKNIGSATVDLTADLMIIDDGATGAIKSTSLANYATALAAGSNEGLKSTAGRLQVDFEDLSTDTALTSGGGDSLVFVDSGDSNASKNITVSNFLTSIAGAGISVSSGKLVSDASPTPQNIGDSAGTLAEGMNFSSANFSAARTWTLPASPDAGDVVSVKAPANAATYNLTIERAGSQTIDGATSVVIESDRGALDLVYVGSDAWVIR